MKYSFMGFFDLKMLALAGFHFILGRISTSTLIFLYISASTSVPLMPMIILILDSNDLFHSFLVTIFFQTASSGMKQVIKKLHSSN